MFNILYYTIKIVMKKLFYILPLALALVSCAPSEVDDIFDESAAVRLDNAIKDYTEYFKKDGGHWNMKYFAAEETQGFNFIMNFNEDGTVEISGKNTYFNLTTDVSTWEVIADYGPVLSFNTYNDALHFFSDPYGVPGYKDDDGTGLGGDYEFLIISTTEERAVLRGKKSGLTIVMDRLHEAVDPATFFNDLETKWSDSFNSLVDTVYITTSTGYQFAAIGHNSGKFDMNWTIFPAAGNREANLVDYAEKVKCMFTSDGIRFAEPLSFFTEHDPDAFVPQDFTFQEDGSLLAEDGVTRITAGPLSRVFFLKRVSFSLDTKDMGGDFKECYDTFVKDIKKIKKATVSNKPSPEFTFCNILDGIVLNRFAFKFTTSGNLDFFVFLDYAEVDDNTLAISFNPNAKNAFNDNARTFYTGDYIEDDIPMHTDPLQAYIDLVSMITSHQWSIKTDNVLCPKVMTVSDKNNPDSYFVVKLVDNTNYLDDTTEQY